METIPWQALTAAGGGWALAIAVMWRTINGYITGNTVTRREADSIEKRAEKAEETRDTLIAQNSELMEMARLGQATFAALQKGAEK